MSDSVNKVILVGVLGRDPEVRSFQTGGRVANLSLATSEKWKDARTGERRERTEWHSVVIHSADAGAGEGGGGLVGVAEKYLRKGSKVYIEGQLQTRKWQDRDGKDRYTTEVVLRGPRAVLVLLGDSGSSNPSGGGSGFAGSSSPSGGNESRELDDEVSF